jgi:hypothetical protein
VAPQLRDETVAEPVDPASGLFGYACPSGAFVPEPGEWRPFEDPSAPSGRPGTRAPHVVLEDGTSTRDLFGRSFVLLTSVDLDLDVEVRHVSGPAFRDAYGIGADGAVLVRPDGVIAWRSATRPTPAAVTRALDAVLARG